MKQKNKEKIIAVCLLFFSLFLSWRLLLASAISFAECSGSECDWQQFAGTAVIGRVGDRTTIGPMINILSKTEYDNGFTENLLRLHRRYNLDRDPYIGMIVKAALDKRTADFNRFNLIELLGEITGEKYGCRRQNDKCSALSDAEKERADIKDVREWWNERKTEGKN